MACVEEVYKHFDIELTGQTYQKMSRFMDERGMDKRKPHIYHAEEYGLTWTNSGPNCSTTETSMESRTRRDRSIQ